MKILKLNPAVRIGDIRLSHAPAMFRWMRDPVVPVTSACAKSLQLKKTEDWIRGVFPMSRRLIPMLFRPPENTSAIGP